MSKKIAVFGSLTQDLFIYPEENTIISQSSESGKDEWYALPHGGKVTAKYLERHGGGGCANVSVSFKRLGLSPLSFGSMGDDEVATWIQKTLEKEAISSEHIQIQKNMDSGFSVILNSFEGERTVIFTSQANKAFTSFPKEVLEREKPEALYLCHLSSHEENTIFSDIESYLTQEPSTLFAWNPGKERLTKGIEGNKSLLSLCNILFLNKEEAELITQEQAKAPFKSHGESERNKSYEQGAHKEIIPPFASDCMPLAKPLLQAGVQTVVITDGRRGAQIFTTDTQIFSPSVAGERIDTLGAGDGFASCFTASILHGKELQKAAQYASINAASVVSKRGAQDGLMKHEDLYTNE